MNHTLQNTLFPPYPVFNFTEVDGTVLFYNYINSRLADSATVLDFGAGRGWAAEDACPWRRKLAATGVHKVRRIAVDVDPAVLGNPFADEKHVIGFEGEAACIPVADASIDLVICDWVVEHLPDPQSAFAEFRRVLKPGGTVAIRTSNAFHYAYVITRLLGDGKLAKLALQKAQPGRKDEDVFPKLYRANTRRRLKSFLQEAGFQTTVTLTWDAEPAYVGNTKIAGLLGFVLHRLSLAGVLPRAALMGFAVKSE